MKTFAAFALFLSFSMGLASARLCFGQQPKIEQMFPLIVMGPDEKIISDLKPENLVVKGVKATIKRLAFDDRPRRVVLFLDISGSMSGKDSENSDSWWKNAKEMAKEFLANLPAADWVSLDVFAKSEEEVVPYTHDFESIRKAIDALPTPDSELARRVYGRVTYFGNALSTILHSQTQLPSFGDCVVIFSDGEFTDESGVDDSWLRDQLFAKGIRVFLAVASTQQPLPQTLALGIPADSLTRFAADPPYSSNPRLSGEYYPLERAASFSISTGGVSVQVEWVGPYDKRLKPDSLKQVMKEAAQIVQDTYQVQLALGEPLTKQRKIKVEVTGNTGKPLSGLTLLYPQYLEPTPRVTH